MLNRKHVKLEREARWKHGDLWLKRSHASSGEYLQTPSGLIQRSDATPTPSYLSKNWLHFGRQLAKKFDSVRVAQIQELRTINDRSYGTDFIYLELEKQKELWCRALTKPSQAAFEKWSHQVSCYLDLKPLQKPAQIDFIVFSPSTFGYCVHEVLGHRLESDDHQTLYTWGSPWKSIAFDVWDTPGKAGWLGYVPIDDSGQIGQSVKLLDGSSGRQKFLSADSGNSRAESYERHSLIRQRSLEIIAHSHMPLPKGSILFLDEFRHGEFDGHWATFRSSRQRFIDSAGREWRLPTLEIKMTPDIVRSLNPFSKSRVHHLPGGCKKDNQTILTTFSAPHAWCTSQSPIEISQW